MKKILALLLNLLISVNLFAQQTVVNEVEMADQLRADGKIWVVVAVIATVFTGITLFLIHLDRKISKLEKRNQEIIMKTSHILGIIVIAVAIGIIISTAGDASTYVSFNEAEALAKDGDTKAIHVVGNLKKDENGEIVGMKYDPTIDPNHFEFVLVDTNKVEKVVVYSSPKPQDMEKSEKVVVVGRMDKDQFKCEKILMKCPSKYNNNSTDFKEATPKKSLAVTTDSLKKIEYMTIGNFGHLSVIISFVTALVTTFAYLQVSINQNSIDTENVWKKVGRNAFYLHAVAIFSVVFTLYYIISSHRFDYYYAYDNSSLSLPIQYQISSFWQDQEGSFLLWMFWQAILGVILIILNRKSTLEAPLMTVYALVQVFLTSMILGVIIPGIDFKIGSTPFLTLKEAMPDIPVWQMNPDFVPKDGKGLNPLLQNYWMVIHPPTLFLGFALTVVPFAYLMAGLWQKQVIEWIRPALPWTLVAGCVLGVGILMGGYWAYETLSFNSYWSWDPVENAVYVPWVVLIAALHTMIIARKNATALKASVILVIMQFVLILYSTFLTRSGILGNASVHSFTDLGLSGQLLCYLLAFIAVSIFLSARVWKLMPSDKDEVTVYSREFWLFMGATVLCLASFQVILPTSIPVWNKIVEAFGGVSNLAPPSDAMLYYSKFQLWFYATITILSGVGQYFWWKKVGQNNIQNLLTPLMVTLLISAVVISVGGVNKIPYMFLVTASIFGLVTNLIIIAGIVKGNYRISGGAITHVGVALMLIGILYSSGYQKVVSLNNTGLLISKDEFFTKDDNKENKENVLLWINTPSQMGNYLLTYRGPRIEIRDVPEYVKWTDVEVLEGDFRAVCLKDIKIGEKTYHKKGDTVEVYHENVFYEVDYRDAKGKITTLYPRAQMNEQMGFVVSPDIKREASKDLYSFVTEGTNPRKEEEWSPTEEFKVAIQDTFFVNDYVAILENVGKTDEIDGVKLGPNDIAVKAQIRVLDKEHEYTIAPTYAINQDRMVMRKPEVSEELGLRIQLMEIQPQTGQFVFNVNRKQRDFIVMKVVEKPLINLLWIGTLILIVGFVLATIRRFRDFKKMQDRSN